ncbi:STM4011 family radical SAM protein [Lachnospiraceae bacterium 62-35]
MDKHMILYRGSLKSCNYHCSYCPFSKHPISNRELQKDREQWFRFVPSLIDNASSLGIHSLMVVPYGEALIHSWYWEGLAHITASSSIKAAGIQTNLSFSVEAALAFFAQEQGNIHKLRLWATFHPEMTSVSDFVHKCTSLKEAGISLCTGAVGVPEQLEPIRRLRKELPADIYLWINAMDGMKRPYTEEEREAFLDIDPYFLRELAPVPAEIRQCAGRLFVEGDGKMHTCNISPILESNWYHLCQSGKLFPSPQCRRKACTCYLAYGGRRDFMNYILFGPYPLFRIPQRPKAVFLDIDGTLIPENTSFSKAKTPFSSPDKSCHTIPPLTEAGLNALFREHTLLFFATSLPYTEAIKRCASVRHLFCGGIFAGGAHLVLEEKDIVRRNAPFPGFSSCGEPHKRHNSLPTEYGDNSSSFPPGQSAPPSEGSYHIGKSREISYIIKEYFYPLDASCLPVLESLKRKLHFRILTYCHEDILFKITLVRPSSRPWNPKEAEHVFTLLSDTYRIALRWFIEGRCLQIVSVHANKANGVRELCRWLHLSPSQTAAAGNSEEDLAMLSLCGMP